MTNSSARRIFALCVVSIAVPIIALGILRDLTLVDLVSDSNWIVTGRVQQIESRWNDARDYIYTYVTITVDEYWKNPLDDSQLVVQIPGGIMDDIMQQVSDTPVFSSGETIVLFLFDKDGRKWVYGWEKGKYTVRDGQVSELGISLAEFKSQVMDILHKGVDHE
jgi:phage baseplate assembly protein gpV